MMNKFKDAKIFTNVILPLIPMILWGSLFPFIKIGYEAFNINTSSVADILMFAAFRFTICGASVIGYTLWYYVQRTVSLSKLFIIKFAEPPFACVFGAILLGEDILKL